jgi:hypothetical protein
MKIQGKGRHPEKKFSRGMKIPSVMIQPGKQFPECEIPEKDRNSHRGLLRAEARL